MGWPVVTVASGGIPVTDVSGTNSIGIPVDEAANGFGTAVTYVASGGIGVLGRAQASFPTGTPFASDGASAPWVQTAIGPAAVHDTSNNKTWLFRERGVASANKRLVMVSTRDTSNNWSRDYLAGKNTLVGDLHGVPAGCVVGGYGFVFYGAHTSTMRAASTANANDPSIWFDQPDITGNRNFPNPIGDATNIYLANTIASPSAGGGVEAAIEMRVYTPTGPTLGSATVKTLVDGYDGSHFGFTPVCQCFESADGTEIYILTCWAITIAETVTSINLLRYVKSTGSLKSWDGSVTVLAASQPINYATLQASFTIANPTDGGFPAGALDLLGNIHVVYGDGNLSLNGVLKHITAAPAGAFSAATTLFTYPAAVDPLNVEAAIVARSDNGVDAYFCDGTSGYGFPGDGATPAGKLLRKTRSSGGVWTASAQILQSGLGLDEPSAVYKGPSSCKLITTEVSTDYTTMSGVLKSYALDSAGTPIIRASVAHSTEAGNFLARTSGLNAAHTAAYYELIDGLVADGVFSQIDALHLFAAQNSTTALLNLCSASYPVTVVGSPTFTADHGYAGPPWDNSNYLDPGFNPATASSPKYTQNSATLAAWTLSNIQGGAIIGTNTAGSNVSYIYPRFSDDHSYVNVNTGTDVDPGVVSTDSSGLTAVSRRASTGYSHYKDGVNVGNVTAASSAVVNGAVTIGGGHSLQASWNAGNVAASIIGGGLTDNQMRSLYMRLYVYMVTIAGIS